MHHCLIIITCSVPLPITISFFLYLKSFHFLGVGFLSCVCVFEPGDPLEREMETVVSHHVVLGPLREYQELLTNK